ncbi:hypothetical protein BRN15_13460, partial [Xanthomonas oryzae pv. oryzae]
HRSLIGMPASASRRKPMICSSEKRFFTSNLLGVGNWTPNGGATQTRGGRRPSRYMPSSQVRSGSLLLSITVPERRLV